MRPFFHFCFVEPSSHFPHKLFTETTNVPLISLLPSLCELQVSHICSPSIIAVWRTCLKAAGGERQHLQSNSEERCEISGRGSFPPCPWAGDQMMRKPALDTQHLPLAPWCKQHANLPLTYICQPGVKLCVPPLRNCEAHVMPRQWRCVWKADYDSL